MQKMPLTLNEYQDLAGITEKHWTVEDREDLKPQTYHALKLSGEAGEVADLIGKTFTGKQLNLDRVLDEYGDVLWHLARGLASHGLTLNDCAEYNLEKLAKRHGSQFNPEFYGSIGAMID